MKETSTATMGLHNSIVLVRNERHPESKYFSIGTNAREAVSQRAHGLGEMFSWGVAWSGSNRDDSGVPWHFDVETTWTKWINDLASLKTLALFMLAGSSWIRRILRYICFQLRQTLVAAAVLTSKICSNSNPASNRDAQNGPESSQHAATGDASLRWRTSIDGRRMNIICKSSGGSLAKISWSCIRCGVGRGSFPISDGVERLECDKRFSFRIWWGLHRKIGIPEGSFWTSDL